MSSRSRSAHRKHAVARASLLVPILVLASAASSRASDWCQVWSGDYADSSMDGRVHCFAVFQGDLYAGGEFQTAGGQSAAGLARWNASQQAWEPLPILLYVDTTAEDPRVYTMLVHDPQDGSGEQLYVGGMFDHAGGLEAYSIARWNGSVWSQVDYGLTEPNSTLADCYALEVADDGDPNTPPPLLAGGTFTHARNYPGGPEVLVNRIAVWANDWHPLATGHVPPGLNDTVRAIQWADDPNAVAALGTFLMIGGDFTGTADGAISNLNHLAFWHGRQPDYWGPWPFEDLGPDPSVHALEAVRKPNGQHALFIGGRFDLLGDDNIAEWDGTGYGPIGSLNGAVHCLEYYDAFEPDGSGSRLYIGGEFTQMYYSGQWQSANYAAYYAGAVWRNMAAGVQFGSGPKSSVDGMNNYVHALMGRSDAQSFGRRLFVGGAFSTAGESAADHIAVWEPATWPVFDLEPNDVTVCPGDSVVFRAHAVGTEPITYQWRKDDVDIPGEADPNLVLTGVEPNDAGFYRCVVSNQCDDYEGSRAAELVVGYAPQVTITQWGDPFCVGDTIHLYAGTDAVPPADSYEWYFNDGSSSVRIPDANDASLDIPNATTADEGWYYAVVANPCGLTTSATFPVDILEPPTVVATVTPDPPVLCEGGTVRFSASPTGGDPSFTFQWRKNGVDIPAANALSYQIDSVEPNDAGAYTVAVTNVCDTTVSNAVDLVVKYAPRITQEPASANPCFLTPATFSVQVDAYPAATFQWVRDGNDIPGATDASLTIPSATFDDEVSYAVTISNECGEVQSAPATLTVKTGAECVECGTFWNPSIGDPGLAPTVYAVAAYDDGTGIKLYAGGDFTVAGGAPANYLALWDGDAWQSVADPNALNGPVRAMAVFASDVNAPGPNAPGPNAPPLLVLGGEFDTALGLPVNYVASWDGLNFAPVGSGLDAPVHALTVFDDDGNGPMPTTLYAGGTFSATSDGTTPLHYIAQTDGALWWPVGDPNALDGPVYAFETLDPNSGGPTLYAGGEFTIADGLPADHIAAWDPLAAVWSDVGGGVEAPVAALAYFDDSVSGPALYAGMKMPDEPNGLPLLDFITRWDGLMWQGVDAGLGGPVLALEPLNPDGRYPRLMAGGEFLMTADGATILDHLAILDAGVWSAVGDGVDGNVHTLLAANVTDDSDAMPLLTIGGLFGQAGGQPSGSIAEWGCSPPPCPGDLDGDGSVDLDDLTLLLQDYGCSGGGCSGDVDGDGDTDLDDLTLLLQNFGSVCA